MAGYLIEERRRSPVITATHEDNALNKFRIVKARNVQMRKRYQSPGQDEKLILLYFPGRGLNSRLPHTVASNMVRVSHALNHSAKGTRAHKITIQAM